MTNGHARPPLPNPLPHAGEGANESLREFHNNLPLRGLTIAVTRPRDQAAQLAQRIAQAGGTPLLFPLLDIATVQDDGALKEQLSRLSQFDLAIFISPNAVQYGMAAVRSAGGLPARLRIATVGQGSAKALREIAVENVIAPSERFDSEGLLALPELQGVAGWRVLIFRGDGGRELLGDTLKARGAMVEYAACYRRSKPQQDIGTLLAAAPDVITVTSSEALTYLQQKLEAGDDPGWRDIPLFVLHARIAGLATQQGWRQVVTTAPGDDGLLAGLLAWAKKEEPK